MRRLRKENPALHPAHGKSLKLCAPGIKSACGTCARREPVNVTPHGSLA
nr:MAG TPA: hypothetical protein [Caudoviricetes sp.]